MRDSCARHHWGHSPVSENSERQAYQDRDDRKKAAVEPMLAEQRGFVRHSRMVYACFGRDSLSEARPRIMGRCLIGRKRTLKCSENVASSLPALRVRVVEPNAEASLNFCYRRYLVPVATKAEAPRRVICNDGHSRWYGKILH